VNAATELLSYTSKLKEDAFLKKELSNKLIH